MKEVLKSIDFVLDYAEETEKLLCYLCVSFAFSVVFKIDSDKLS